MNTYGDKFYLNIGAGRFARKDWRSIDYVGEDSECKSYQYDKKLIDFNLNLLKNPAFPINDNCVDLIFSSHVFEHLHDDNVMHILKESYRVLKKQGGIRLTMPDIDLAYKAYQENDIDFFIKINNQPQQCKSLLCKFFDYFSSIKIEDYNEEELVENFTNLSKSDFLDKYTNDIENSDHREFNQHMNWFNEEKLKKLLKASGFKNIQLSQYKKSSYPEMRSSQFDQHPEMSFYVEAVK